jgi:hypothetical protein
MAAFTDHLRLCSIAVSLGDLKTLVYPMPKRDNLIRVSVGCEDLDDLLEDFALGVSHVAERLGRRGISALPSSAAAAVAPIVSHPA